LDKNQTNKPISPQARLSVFGSDDDDDPRADGE
jgi:hypothetical protein